MLHVYSCVLSSQNPIIVVAIDDVMLYVLRRKITLLTWLIDSHGLKADIIFSRESESLACKPLHLLL
jgi:hypothetical protein